MTSTRRVAVSPPQSLWCEEELRMVEQITPSSQVPNTRSYASQLCGEISARAITLVRAGIDECTRDRVIFAPGIQTHGNFIDASYRAIIARPAWSRRLTKPHTSKRQARATGENEEVRAWCELDSATSSDALLMNIFCYPRLLKSLPPRTLLGISAEPEIDFGYHPHTPRLRGLVDRTEIDLRLGNLRLGNLLIEAKLTEADFQAAPLRLVERYVDFDTVFDRDELIINARGVASYQLIRGVLAAYAKDARFCVLCDARRPDLVEAWYAVIKAVRSLEMQARLQIVFWQELAACAPSSLQTYLAAKYGIVPEKSR